MDYNQNIEGGAKAFYIQRLGNKINDIKYFEKYLPFDVKNVVEPFGGSFAVIRKIYYDDKYNKYVNDMDPMLYYIYIHPNELKKGYMKWNEINERKINSDKKKELLQKSNLPKHIKEYLENSMFVRGTVTKSKNIDNIDEDIEFIKKINFSHEDAFKIIDKFRTKENTFIFLDPPYLFSDNSSYASQNEDTDMTDYYLKFLDILNDKTTKAKIMLIINDMKILRELYKKYIKGDYEKIYQIGKKKSKHLVITNY